MSYKPPLNLIDFDSNSHDENCSNICSDCLNNQSSSNTGSFFCLSNSTPTSTVSTTSDSCSTSSSHSCSTNSSHSCIPSTETCTKNEVRTIIKDNSYIIKIGCDTVIPKGIRTVLVDSDNRQIKIVLPLVHLKCISTSMGTVYSSQPLTIVNLGCGMIVIKAPSGQSIYKKIKYILKPESSVTFQQFDNMWYPLQGT